MGIKYKFRILDSGQQRGITLKGLSSEIWGGGVKNSTSQYVLKWRQAARFFFKNALGKKLFLKTVPLM
jgi:hypothetical protein